MPKAKTKKAKVKMQEFTVTEEYLKANPELVEEGLEVGDVIEIPAEENPAGEGRSKEEADVAAEKDGSKKVGLKTISSKGGTAIIRNGDEFIRVYPADMNKADITAFVGKDPKYSAMPAEKISSLKVEFDSQKDDPKTGEVIFFRESEAFSREDHGDDMFTLALKLKNEKRGVIKFY